MNITDEQIDGLLESIISEVDYDHWKWYFIDDYAAAEGNEDFRQDSLFRLRSMVRSFLETLDS